MAGAKFVFVILFFAFVRAIEVPSFLHVCRRYDPKLPQCLTAAVEGLRPFLAAGVPEYNIPSIEPLYMNNLTNKNVGITFTSTDVKAYGCSEFFVRKFRSRIDDQLFELDIEVPKLKIISNFTVQGRFLIVPINGVGIMETDIKNCKTKIILKGEIYEDAGEKYMKFVACETRIKFGRGYVDLGDIFGRDNLLNFVLTDVANKNFEEFSKQLTPSIEVSLSTAVLEIANNIASTFTFKQLFPH